MDKKSLISLLSTTLFLASFNSLAERPAAEDETNYSTQVEEVSIVDDMRPAAETEMAPPAVTEKTVVDTEQVSSGDTLAMPGDNSEMVEATAQAIRTLDFPRRGMTQDKVQNELGRPGEIVPAVGQPPISRWIYNDRVVYFEYSSVIHVVAK
jgi:hypothetical protein